MVSSSEALLVALNDSSDSDYSIEVIEDGINPDEEEIESKSDGGTPLTVSCTTSSISSCNTTVPSLLDILHAPKLSEISRKRKIYSSTNDMYGDKRRKKTKDLHLQLQNRKLSNHNSH